MRSLVVALVLVALSAGPARAQPLSPPVTGPVFDRWGPVWDIEAPDFPTDTDRELRVVSDVSEGAAAPDQLNRRIETVARYVNMHARAGVPRENMRLALVLHGSAGKDLLDHAGYRERHGVDNPNLDLLEALVAFGVDVVLCGQTQHARGLRREELMGGARVALSAMTVIVSLQSRGYSLVAF